jgi:hypothetical protein
MQFLLSKAIRSSFRPFTFCRRCFFFRSRFNCFSGLIRLQCTSNRQLNLFSPAFKHKFDCTCLPAFISPNRHLFPQFSVASQPLALLNPERIERLRKRRSKGLDNCQFGSSTSTITVPLAVTLQSPCSHLSHSFRPLHPKKTLESCISRQLTHVARSTWQVTQITRIEFSSSDAATLQSQSNLLATNVCIQAQMSSGERRGRTGSDRTSYA